MPGRLNGKVAIITGGSTGIGKGIAKIFADEGAKVAICARNEKLLADALKEISSESVIAVKCDVTKSVDVKNLSLKEAFADMAAASKAGAKSTSKMVATKGRTRYAGERSLGYEDAGVNTVTLIINAFYTSLL